MAYDRTYWTDHQINPDTGQIDVQGLLVNATRLNNLEKGVSENNFMASQLAQSLRQVMNSVNNLIVEIQTVTLTSTLRYPFNDSKITVALGTLKNTTDYTVYAEVVSYTGGGYGNIEITEKLSNGFKVAFTGGATSVVVKLYISGGIEKKGVF